MDSLGTDFNALLTRAALVALLAAGVWAVLLVVAVALEVRTGGRVRLAERAGCPPVLRRWLLAVLVAVLSGVAPAHASETGGGGPGNSSAGALDGSTLDGLPLPDRSTDPEHQVVVVRRGDSLWRIARGLLPDRVGDDVLARAVTPLYAENRRTIGPDPDLLEPGQRLTTTRLTTDFPDPTRPSEEP